MASHTKPISLADEHSTSADSIFASGTDNWSWCAHTGEAIRQLGLTFPIFRSSVGGPSRLARLSARHMMPAMTTAAAKPRPIRRAVGAVLIPTARFEAWHGLAIQTPHLTDLDRKVPAAIRDWYRRLYVEEFAGSLSYGRMGRRLDADPVHVRWAVERLLELGLVAVKPGAGGRANTYLLALPRRLVAAMSAAAVEDAPPF